MNFDKHSNFNPKANFSEVKFGENMPVLEVELNEMQQIQNEARADIIRDSIPSGFVTLGEIDYEYCKSNDNQIKLKTESIAYVNGYRITIPKDTIIEIGESDKVREDLVFLEVWKEAVNDIDTLTEYGGENNAVINNPIKDERYPIATSQRVALKYRIRHVADLDFNKKWTSGTSSIHPYIGWNNTNSFSPIYAIGGDEAITKPTSVGAYKLFRCATYDDSSYPKFSDDSGLWVAGRNDETSFEYFKNACIDGYVYAIPMFRLLRKPNVGLASPFEYKKIHNQLDPKKFAHLVNQENVEKVHSVNVVGKTYTNLLTYATTQGNGATNVTISPEKVTFNTTTSWGKVGFLINGQPNTKYIFHCADFFTNGINKWVQFYVRYSSDIHGGTGTLTKIDENTYTFTTDTTGIILFTFEIPAEITGAFVDSPIIMKYSEWNDELRGKTIVGMQSLGQEQNNTISIENNLVKEGVYVPELQNHILPTHPEVTHVSWGEDVVIPPEVEIELKRGEELLQTITQLPVKLETTGEEKLHVKTMKGRTLVNLLNPNESVNTVTVSGGSQSWITVGSLISTLDVSKKYLVKLNVKQNTVDNLYGVYLLLRQLGVQGNTQYVPVASVVENGYVIITPDSDKTQIDSISIYAKDSVTSGSLVFDSFTIIEYQEGMENWVNKSFSGMKSVEAPSIKITGKNIFDNNFTVGGWWNGVANINPSHMRSVNLTPVKPNTTYTYNSTVSGHRQNANFMAHDINGNFIKYLGFCQTFTTPPNCHYIHLYTENDSTLYAQIEEGTISTPIEPYTSNSFKTPKGTVLRSLSQSVFDYIDFDTGVLNRKIGEKVVDSSINPYGLTQQVNGSCFHINTSNDNITFDSDSRSFTISDRFSLKSWSNTHQPNTMFYGSGHDLYFVLPSSVTTTKQVKEWFRDNPTTLNYVLATPLNEKIGLSEDDYAGKSKITYQLTEPLRSLKNVKDYISDNVLYRHIGVEIFDGSESWAKQSGSTTGFYLKHSDSTTYSLVFCPQLPSLANGWGDYSTKGIFRGESGFGVVVNPSDLTASTLEAFKTWLSNNPITVMYIKAEPLQIPLNEVTPNEANFSLSRQFNTKYAGYLQQFTDGTKDILLTSKKVERHLRYLIFNGTENWTLLSTTDDVIRAYLNVTTSSELKPLEVSPILNSYDYPYGTASTTRAEMGVDQNGHIVVALPKTLLSSSDLTGFKNYLKCRNLHVIFKVKTPYSTTTDKPNYVPYMPVNSYVGSLYVANGINQTKFLTAFSPSEYEVQTYHRYFSNEYNLFEDIAPKKSPYGHVTVPHSLSSNIHDGKFIENTGFILSTGLYESASQWIASVNKFLVKKGVTYHVKVTANDNDITENKRYIYIYKYDTKGNYLTQRIDVGTRTSFTSDFDGYALLVMKTMNVSHIQVTPNVAVEEEVKYRPTELIVQGIEKYEIEDLRHKVSLTGFDYNHLLQDSFLKLIKGELS